MRLSWAIVLLCVLAYVHGAQATVPEDRVRAFTQFLHAQGFEFPADKLGVVAIPGAGYGVRALGKINAGDLLVNVSKSALLTTRTYLPSKYAWAKEVEEIFPPAQDSGIASCGFMAAVDALDPASVFQPYYQLLPRTFSVPEYWSEADVQGLPFFETLRTDRLKYYQTVWEKTIELRAKYPASFGRVSFEQLKWGIAICRTRSWSDQGNAGVLVPLADLFNHDCTGRAGNVRDEYFSLSSGRTYEAGEEIFDNYGGKSSLALLIGYGFNPEVHECDQFMTNAINVDGSIPSPDWARLVRRQLFEKQKWIAESELSGQAMYFSNKGHLSHNLLRWLRIASVPLQDMGFLVQHLHSLDEGEQAKFLQSPQSFWSYESELAAYRRLVDQVDLRTSYLRLNMTMEEVDAWSAARPNKTFVQEMVVRTARNMIAFHDHTVDMMKNLWRVKLLEADGPIGEKYFVSDY